MIPRADIVAWRSVAPWPDEAQVEQDLVLTRALCELYTKPSIADGLAFRGGTALHKLHFSPPGRYSEDLDFVQMTAGPIGRVLDEVRATLDPWLGEPRSARNAGSFKLRYTFQTESRPIRTMRVKIEINTREHFAIRGFVRSPLTVATPWFSGSAELTTFTLEELLATKLRALYQRSRGRDLYDLWLGLTTSSVDSDAIVGCFSEYMTRADARVSRAEFEQNLDAKSSSKTFKRDVESLLRDDDAYDVDTAMTLVLERLIARLPGEGWRR